MKVNEFQGVLRACLVLVDRLSYEESDTITEDQIKGVITKYITDNGIKAKNNTVEDLFQCSIVYHRCQSTTYLKYKLESGLKDKYFETVRKLGLLNDRIKKLGY